MSDYYDLLGIGRDASVDDIKKAYRKKAKEYHPDSNQDDPTAEDNFKKINEAYEVLKNPEKKSNYDMFGDADGRPTSNASSHGFGSGFQDAGDMGNMNDIINEYMRSYGNRSGFHFDFQQPKPQKNPDLLSEMTITLEDAYIGKTATVELTEPNGNVKNINITIPPGSKHGLTLRLKNKGYNNDPNLPAGNLQVSLNIAPHHIYAVIGMDLMMKKSINMIDAALGKEIEVTLLDGKIIKVIIPEGTQPEQKIRLKGKGMPGLGNTNVHGDLYIIITVEVPTNLTDEQRDILRKF